MSLLPLRNKLTASHLIAVMVFCLGIGLATAEEPKQALPVQELKRKAPVDFEHELLPILKANCLACHNQTSSKGDLVLETPQTILKGGESGSAVTPGKPGESLLFQVASHQKRPSMPPKENKVAATDLKPEELGLLKLWIEQGAKGEVRNAIPIEWGAMPGSLHPSYAVAITADGQFAACSRANQIAVYHLPTRQLVTKLKDKAAKGAAHLDAVQSLDFNPSGTLLASSAFREVKFWSRKADASIESLDSSNGVAELSSDGALIAFASSTNAIVIRDLRTKTNSANILITNASLSRLKFSADEQMLAAMLENGSVSLFQVSQNAAFTNLAVGATAFTWLSSNRFAVATASNVIEVWSITNLSALPETRLPSQVDSITALAGAGDALLIGDEKGVVHVRSFPSGKEIQKLKQESSLTSLGVSGDGRHYVSAGSNNVVKLWSSEGKLIAELKGDRFANEAMAAAERKLALAKGETAFQKAALQSAQKEHTNQVTRVSKATATNELADKIFSEKQKVFEAAKEAKIKLEKQLTGLQEELRAATNEVAVTKTNLPPATTEAPKETTATTITNKPAVTVGPLQDKIKEAVGKLTTASNALVTAERDFKKAELTRSIAAHELGLAGNSLTNATRTLSNTVATLEKAEAAEKRRESSLGRAKERATKAQVVTRAICFSPDNLTLATLDDASGIHTWNLESGQPIEVYHPTNGPVLSLSFSTPDQLEALSRTHLHRWKTMPAWKLTRAVGSPDGDSPFADRVNCVRFSRDGKFFATGGGEPSRMGEIKVWKTDTGELFRDLSTIHSDSVFSLDFSPDGKLLASGAADKFLRVSSLETGKQVKTFEGHTHHVLGVSWKADGRALASAGADSMLKTWNAVTGERIKNIEGFGKEVTAASFLGVTGQVLAAAGDGQLRLVKENGDNVRSFSGATDFLYAAAATPDGKLVVAAGLDGVLRVWNGEDGKLAAEFAP